MAVLLRPLTRLLAVLAAAVALVALLVPGAPASASPSDEGHFVDRLNAERAAAGAPALTHVADLQAVARRHAQAMADSGKLFHNPSLSRDVADWSRLAENVGFGGGAEAVHVALMNSAGHRANILDRGVTQVGVGVVWSGTRLWVTQVFRMPTGAAVSAPPAASTAPAPAAPVTLPSACDGAPGAPFQDVPRNAWYVGAVDCAVDKALAFGVTQTAYAPQRDVTRAQMASFLHRVLQRSESPWARAEAPDLFHDDNGSPHELAINRLAAIGVLQGTGPGTYTPAATVTRGQMASMLVRLQEKLTQPMPTSGVPFTDVAGSPHAEAIDKVFTAGITSGTTASTYAPNTGVRRDGMSVFLVREYGQLAEAGAVR